MWDLNSFFEKSKEKILIDDAWEQGLFENLTEMKHKEFSTGFVHFFSTSPIEMFHYMKHIGVVEFIPWRAFRIGENWKFFSDFQFKTKTRKKRKGNIPQSKRDKIDSEHKKIKGQKSKLFW